MILPDTGELTLTDWLGRALTVPGILTTIGRSWRCTLTIGNRSGVEDESKDLADVEDEALQAESMSNNIQLIFKGCFSGLSFAMNFVY